ncbi:MAG: Na+/H+ antiporter NhaA, partial [Chloroflexi bacterium]|nr:Na+/H+ antiporter NhaA [Chloroflexota bacterium]
MPAAMGANGLVGPYHLAWEIDTIEGLAEMAKSLGELVIVDDVAAVSVIAIVYSTDVNLMALAIGIGL